MTRLPEPSSAVPHAPTSARVARLPSPSGPKLPVPAGVVSCPPRMVTRRTVWLAATCTEPPANDTPQGDRDTLLAGAGPGALPPATVEISPAARARAPAGPDCPAAAAG